MTTEPLEDQLEHFRVSAGRLAAERKDLSEGFEPQDTPPRFEVQLGVFPGTDSLRINLELTVDDVYAHYDVIFAGVWLPAEGKTLEYPHDIFVTQTFAVNHLATRILAVAEAKVAELSQAIDCPGIEFPHQLDIRLATIDYGAG